MICMIALVMMIVPEKEMEGEVLVVPVQWVVALADCRMFLRKR